MPERDIRTIKKCDIFRTFVKPVKCYFLYSGHFTEDLDCRP